MVRLNRGVIMAVQSVKLDQNQIKQLLDECSDLHHNQPPQYASHQLLGEGISITIYNSKKVVFQGKLADVYAAPYLEKDKNEFPQAGSDETGTGSYFGPMVVCACYIDDDIHEKIKHYKLADSKDLKDDRIMEIAPFLMELVPHSLLVLDNHKYNQLQKSQNQNLMLAKMHNKAFINLKNKGYSLPKMTVIDQFTPKNTYYKYLNNEDEVIDHLIFETKAENKYISVACASVIARYAFLVALMQLSKYYDHHFLSGAGSNVDENAREFLKKHDQKELASVAKLHFANTKRIL